MAPLCVEMGWNEADLAECTPEFLNAIISELNRRAKEIKRWSKT
jgi:hypothetical protein